MDIIYCAGGNKKLASIAITEGFLYGARSDDIRNIHCDGLVDINWEKYNWTDHVEQVRKHHPKYSVVPDITNLGILENTLCQAREVENFCERVIVVPKIHQIINVIPRKFVIGISVPTSYSGFIPLVRELRNREVHLLGGTPKQQRELWLYYKEFGISVVSADGNSHSKASDFGSYWNGSKWCKVLALGKYETFRMSCKGIMTMWKSLGAI